jgi:xylose isomerase
MSYKPERALEEKIRLARAVEGLDGLELCYPADFSDPALLKKLMAEAGLGISAVNVRSRRTGKWLRGSFTSQNPEERAEVVEDFKRAIDLTLELGCNRITTCPLNDGHDYVFEMNYLDAYRYAEETFAKICAHQPDVKVCIEYKWNDPRTRCLLASAGESAAFCQAVDAPNLGVTLDIGHALLAGERPAQSVALLSRAKRLFYVHLNDNDRNWDWDMIPGAFHFWEFVEFLYYLKEIGYEDDWYGYDVFSKEIDTLETFNTVVNLTRRLEEMAGRIDHCEMEKLLEQRNPARSLSYLYGKVLR